MSLHQSSQSRSEREFPFSGRAFNLHREMLQNHHFRSGRETTLHRYVWLYNQQLPQSVLGSKTPLQAMKDWHKLQGTSKNCPEPGAAV